MELIIKSWEKVLKEMVTNSMKSCALVLAIDGSQDGLISYFKEWKKCKVGRGLLESQM